MIGYAGILIFLISPFISPKGQFSIPLRVYEGRLSGKRVNALKVGQVDSLRILENAFGRRIAVINEKDSTGNIYVVCAMWVAEAGLVTSQPELYRQ